MATPEQRAWPWSSLTYGWVGPIFSIARERAVELTDMLAVPPHLLTRVNADKFENLFYAQLDKLSEKERTEKKIESIFIKSIWKVVRGTLYAAGLFRLVTTILQMCLPFIIAELLEYIEDIENRELYEGFIWAFSLGFITALIAFLENRYQWYGLKAGWKAKGATSLAIFRKSLRLTTTSRRLLSQGQMLNLIQLDTSKIERFGSFVHTFWDSVFAIVGFSGIIYFYIQEATFLGLAVLLISLPIQGRIIAKLFYHFKRLAENTDERVAFISQTMSSILAVKTSGLEFNFIDRIDKLRDQELQPLKDSLYLRSVMMSLLASMPTFAAVAALSFFGITQEGKVTASIIFASIQGFNSLRIPLFQLPAAVTSYNEALVAMKRIAKFLSFREEKQDNLITLKTETKPTKENESDIAITIKNGAFSWGLSDDKKEEVLVKENSTSGKRSFVRLGGRIGFLRNSIILRRASSSSQILATKLGAKTISLVDVNLEIPKGSLTCIVGPYGSGKSSLLSAIIGDMIQVKGTRTLTSEVALVNQVPWILSGSFKSNILFNEPFDEQRYEAVLTACQLRKELERLPNGDDTQIGAQGVNLSGGQSQQLCIARAVYSSKPIVVLDDPFSSFNPKVAERIFREVCLNLMQDRTVVLTTNQFNFVELCDHVIYMGLDDLKLGQKKVAESSESLKIAMQGTFQKLQEQNEDFATMLQRFQETHDHSEDLNADRKVLFTDSVATDKEVENGNLAKGEDRRRGPVDVKYYFQYITAGGVCLFFIALFLLIAGQAANLVNVFAVSLWADDADLEERDLEFYLGIYAVSGIVASIFYFAQTYGFFLLGIRASRTYHHNVITGILKAPMEFFDTTPNGRIVSRLSRDVLALDTELPENYTYFVFMMVNAVFTIGAIGFELPYFLIIIPFIIFFYYLTMRKYRPAGREVKRLESVQRSPILIQFSETLMGIASIRAYGKNEDFVKNCDLFHDNKLKATYIFKALERWMAVRLELTSAVLLVLTACLLVYTANEGQIDPGTAGVVLTLTLTFTGVISSIMRSVVRVEVIFNYVERLSHYADGSIGEEPNFFSDPTVVNSSWPEKGEIVFDNVSMSYREGTPLVLKNLSVTIPASSKVGIVGRTGGGKSTIFRALLRSSPLVDGAIRIDNIDISQIGLSDLRQKITLVPQDPILFNETLRFNLDPFNRHNASEIWTVLDKVGLYKKFKNLDKQLSTDVTELGRNFCHGERQLISLARALLNKSKILLLDKPTSAVDHTTDVFIRKALRTNFANCTILTIVHRIHTVVDYDNVVVLDKGKAEEFGSPSSLLNNETSVLSKLVRQAGTEAERRIRKQVFQEQHAIKSA